MSEPYRILVTGSRTWTDRAAIESALNHAARSAGDRPIVVVHGACRGADDIADDIAWRRGWEREPWPANWDRHGRAAGPIRNTAMVAAGADVCLAFPLGRAIGTSNCVRSARHAGIPVVKVQPLAPVPTTPETDDA